MDSTDVGRSTKSEGKLHGGGRHVVLVKVQGFQLTDLEFSSRVLG